MATEIETLQTQLRELNDRLADAKRDEKRVALDAIREQVALHGISEDELFYGGRIPETAQAPCSCEVLRPVIG